MKGNGSYNCFARYYDSLTSNVDYKKRANYFDSIIKNFYDKKDNVILVDLACGTGSISEQMSELGYDVIGVDVSEEMLNCALDKKFDSGHNIQYIRQDMRELDMFGTVDVTLCVLDSLNHLDSFDDVKKVFERVSLFAEPNGLFVFDVNTRYKHREVLSDNVFIYDIDDVYCVWENKYSPKDDEIQINLDFFEYDSDNDVYRRYNEVFSERAYDISEIDKALDSVGMEVLAHYSDDSFESPNEKTQRVIFVARKVR